MPSAGTVLLICLVIKGSLCPALSPTERQRDWQPPGSCFLHPFVQRVYASVGGCRPTSAFPTEEQAQSHERSARKARGICTDSQETPFFRGRLGAAIPGFHFPSATLSRHVPPALLPSLQSDPHRGPLLPHLKSSIRTVERPSKPRSQVAKRLAHSYPAGCVAAYDNARKSVIWASSTHVNPSSQIVYHRDNVLFNIMS